MMTRAHWRNDCRKIYGPRLLYLIVLTLVAGNAINPVDAADSTEPTVSALSEIVVVASTPLAVADLPTSQVPGNLQTLSASQLQRTHASGIAEALAETLGSFNLNDTQGNPLQSDLNLRGFTASPVLGTPQGLAVFVDGTRVNEVFGDTVNWDLIPGIAISQVLVIPGSNPVFGLSSTGGTLTINTKSGRQFPGLSIEASGGSFGRGEFSAQYGGNSDRIDYFTAFDGLTDTGWADQNASRNLQGFSKVGYSSESTRMDLSYTYSDAHLAGNQTLPLTWLDTPRQSYTWPDLEHDSLNFLNLQFSHRFSERLLLSLNLHARDVQTSTFNSNVNDAFTPGQPVTLSNAPTQNVLDASSQTRSGGSTELNWTGGSTAHVNRLTVGLNTEFGTTGFSQYNQSGGAARDTVSGSTPLLNVLLHTDTADLGAYLSDNFELGSLSFVSLAARYDDSVTTLRDELGTALNGRHATARINPAFGITHNPTPWLTLWASAGQGMRLPTAVELTCANASAPCSLPNAFASDPGLRAVISNSFESGLRVKTNDWSWNAAVFRTSLSHDIEFISSGGGATSSGYFSNVGSTQRQGLELSATRALPNLQLSAHYTFVRARFETPLLLNSPDNSSATLACVSCAQIQVEPGDRMPGVPLHNARLRAEYMLSRRASIAISLLAQSSVYARGDENNQDRNGPVPGFAVVNADARFEFARHWEASLRATNLLNRSYSTFGVLGENEFTGPNRSFDTSGAGWQPQQFRSVGAPFGVWLAIQYRANAL